MNQTQVKNSITIPKEGLRKDRLAALHTLSNQGASAVPALIEALGDGDPDIRSGAAVALGSIGDVSAVSVLIDLMHEGHKMYAVSDGGTMLSWKHGMHTYVRSCAAGAIRRLGDSETLPNKILADKRMSPQARVYLLDKLRGELYRSASSGKAEDLNYAFADTRNLCMKAVEKAHPIVRDGAIVVLRWLDDQDLLRASQPDTTSDADELVRPAQDGDDPEPETLMRPAMPDQIGRN
jgi:hypothetical protein